MWFRSTAFGDDKDRVIIRSDGRPTYFAADIGYVTEKFSRGFDHLIYIWGADHHGTVARVRNAAEAMGFDRDAVEMLLIGWVRFVATARRSRCRSGPGRSSRSTTCWPSSASTPPAGSSRRARPTSTSTSTSSWRRRSRPRTRSTTSSTPTRGSPRSCARRPRPGLSPAAPSTGLLGGRAGGARSRGSSRGCPEVVEDAASAQETQGITAYATELATAVPRLLPRRAGRRPGRAGASAKRLALAVRRNRRSRTRSALLGISAPESM